MCPVVKEIMQEKIECRAKQKSCACDAIDTNVQMCLISSTDRGSPRSEIVVCNDRIYLPVAADVGREYSRGDERRKGRERRTTATEDERKVV